MQRRLAPDRDSCMTVRWLLAIGIVFLWSSCNQVTDPDDAPSTEISNMIPNGSFEEHGNPSLTGWDGRWMPDSSLFEFFSFSDQVPQDGGSWSLSIRPEFEELWVTTTIPAPLPSAYRLTLWARTRCIFTTAGLYVGGSQLLKGRSVEIKDSVWTKYTIDLDSTRVIWVPDSGRQAMIKLDAGISISSGTTAEFDLVRLEPIPQSLVDTVAIRRR